MPPTTFPQRGTFIQWSQLVIAAGQITGTGNHRVVAAGVKANNHGSYNHNYDVLTCFLLLCRHRGSFLTRISRPTRRMSNLAHSSLLKVKMRTHFEMPTGAYAKISHIIIIIPHVLVQCLIMKLCTDIFYVQAGQAWTGIKKEKMHFHSTPVSFTTFQVLYWSFT